MNDLFAYQLTWEVQIPHKRNQMWEETFAITVLGIIQI